MSSTVNIETTPAVPSDTHTPQVQQASLAGLLITLFLAAAVWYIVSSIWAWLFGPRVVVGGSPRQFNRQAPVGSYPYAGQTVIYRGGAPGYYYGTTWVPVVSVGGVYGYYDGGVFIEQPDILVEQPYGSDMDYIDGAAGGYVDDGFNEQPANTGGYVDDGFNEQPANTGGYVDDGFNEQPANTGGYVDDGFNEQPANTGGYVDDGFNEQPANTGGYVDDGFNEQPANTGGYVDDGFNEQPDTSYSQPDTYSEPNL